MTHFHSLLQRSINLSRYGSTWFMAAPEFYWETCSFRVTGGQSTCCW
jgi:hypothetical protein